MLTIARKRASNNLVQERAKANRFANKLTIFLKKMGTNEITHNIKYNDLIGWWN